MLSYLQSPELLYQHDEGSHKQRYFSNTLAEALNGCYESQGTPDRLQLLSGGGRSFLVGETRAL